MAKETAEQKLLKLIEMSGSGGEAVLQDNSASSEARQVLNAVQGVDGSFSVPPFITGITAFFNHVFSAGGQVRFGLKEINRILMIVVSVAVVFVGYNLSQGMDTAKREIRFKNAKSLPFSKNRLLPDVPDFEKYVSVISFRNIFHPYEKKVVVEETAQPVRKADQIFEKTEALRLVGISWFDSAESASAMIENTSSGVTYFLRSGEKINGVTIEAIYADSIVLEFNGEKMEFKL